MASAWKSAIHPQKVSERERLMPKTASSANRLFLYAIQNAEISSWNIQDAEVKIWNIQAEIDPKMTLKVKGWVKTNLLKIRKLCACCPYFERDVTQRSWRINSRHHGLQIEDM